MLDWVIILITTLYVVSVAATPPACFLSCINEAARNCPRKHSDLRCLCRSQDILIGCFVDICPYGNFESARDHFLGTCMEHQVPKDATTIQSSTMPSVIVPSVSVNLDLLDQPENFRKLILVDSSSDPPASITPELFNPISSPMSSNRDFPPFATSSSLTTSPKLAEPKPRRKGKKELM
ncbi:CIC11C00000001789 [Sungouiella intermedia]|uniref:CIC11C00000001789 n=1 Tax=Sungouiella intermedia TaxID=45354 RepID=A0A1L0FSU0_9ASCO|nr:CIC11C00000001789 [[Candida] intermedia]